MIYEGEQKIDKDSFLASPTETVYQGRENLRNQLEDVARYEIHDGRVTMQYLFANQTRQDSKMIFRKAGYVGSAYREQYDGKVKDVYPVVEIVLYWCLLASENVFSKKYGYQTVIREYGRDREKTEKLLKTVGKALLLLEDIRETEEEYLLAVFSAEISGNPHYFDQGTTAGQLLVHGMCYAAQTDYPENAHQWRELLLSGGIVPDNISSIVHIYGLRLQVCGEWHPAYDAFCRRQEPCAVTMENLQELTAVQPTGDKVYLEQKKVTLLCTSGQLRSAAVKLIPFLLDSGAEIYYSGDTDPDGIRIADRLWKKYGDRIHVWRMSEEDYVKNLSEEEIGNVSIKKLETVENPVLCKTAKEVRKKKRAGYQENILKDLLEDMELERTSRKQ